MQALATPFAERASWMEPLLFAAGLVLLLARWALLYWTESMFTESHLTCQDTTAALPSRTFRNPAPLKEH